MSYADIAKEMGKTLRAVQQKYVQLVPTGKIGWTTEIEMTEEMIVTLLEVVARTKPVFWSNVAKSVGHGATARQCEAKWNEMIRTRA